MSKKNSPNGEEVAKAAEKKEAAQQQQSDATNNATQETYIPEFDIGNLPNDLDGLKSLIEKTEEEMMEIDNRLVEIIKELKPQPKIKEITAKTKTKRSPGTSVKRKALKLELNELKNTKLFKRELIERAKTRFDSLFSKAHETKVSNIHKAKGLSIYYVKRNMSRIAFRAYSTIKTISVKEPLKLAAIKQNANKQNPANIYVPVSELIRRYSPNTADLMSGSDTVRGPILNTINEGLIEWDGKSELDLTAKAKETKRKVEKKGKESQISEPEPAKKETPVETKITALKKQRKKGESEEGSKQTIEKSKRK